MDSTIQERAEALANKTTRADMESEAFDLTWGESQYKVSIPGDATGRVVPLDVALAALKQAHIEGKSEGLDEAADFEGVPPRAYVCMRARAATLRDSIRTEVEKGGSDGND